MSDLKKLPREERAKRYWQANQRLILILLAIWFLVTYVQIMFVNQLNSIVIGGFPLGYYMASQGSLIVFVVEIFYYAYAMNKLDDQFGLSDRDR